MASKPGSGKPSPAPHRFRLLLDQGFPKPPGFRVEEIDRSIEVVHFGDSYRDLARSRTPDWLIYAHAARDGFDALVTRDKAQVDQVLEMWVLSRLVGFSVVTWRRRIDDPIQEWGQLLAYLPEVKKRLAQRPEARGAGGVILLPAPTLDAGSVHRPHTTLQDEASARRLSVQQVGDAAAAEVREWLSHAGRASDELDDLLDLRGRPSAQRRRQQS